MATSKLACSSNNKKRSFVEAFNTRSYGKCKQFEFENYINGSSSVVSRLTLTHELPFHNGCVNSLNFNSTGELLLSGSDDLKVALWDWTKDATKPKLTYPSGHSNNVFQTKFMHNTNDRTIVTAARDGQIRVSYLDCLTRLEHTKRVAQHHGSAHKLSVQPGSPNVLLSAGEDAVVYSIDLRQPKPNKLLVLKNSAKKKVPLYSIHINPMNTFEFAVCGRCQWARIYDIRKVAEDKENGFMKMFCAENLKVDSEGKKPNITCLMYNFDGTELLCSYNDEDIYLFDTTHSSESKEVHSYKGHRNSDTVKGVNFFGPRSEYIVSGSDCSNIFFWDKNTEEVVTYFQGDGTGVVNVLEPHPSCSILATAGLDHQVKIWEPIGEKFSNKDHLDELIQKNMDQRKEDQARVPGYWDDQFVFLMIRHLQRQRVVSYQVRRSGTVAFYQQQRFASTSAGQNEQLLRSVPSSIPKKLLPTIFQLARIDFRASYEVEIRFSDNPRQKETIDDIILTQENKQRRRARNEGNTDNDDDDDEDDDDSMLSIDDENDSDDSSLDDGIPPGACVQS